MDQTSIKRIKKDIKELELHPNPLVFAAPLESNIFEWHFTVCGPPDTEYEGGLYHGRILLPTNWPFSPPKIIFMNESGRFEQDKAICLSLSHYHPEEWNPQWGITTILEAIISFFPDDSPGAIGAVSASKEVRKDLAIKSVNYVCPHCGAINRLIKPSNKETIENYYKNENRSPVEQASSISISRMESISETKNQKEQLPLKEIQSINSMNNLQEQSLMNISNNTLPTTIDINTLNNNDDSDDSDDDILQNISVKLVDKTNGKVVDLSLDKDVQTEIQTKEDQEHEIQKEEEEEEITQKEENEEKEKSSMYSSLNTIQETKNYFNSSNTIQPIPVYTVPNTQKENVSKVNSLLSFEEFLAQMKVDPSSICIPSGSNSSSSSLSSFPLSSSISSMNKPMFSNSSLSSINQQQQQQQQPESITKPMNTISSEGLLQRRGFKTASENQYKQQNTTESINKIQSIDTNTNTNTNTTTTTAITNTTNATNTTANTTKEATIDTHSITEPTMNSELTEENRKNDAILRSIVVDIQRDQNLTKGIHTILYGIDEPIVEEEHNRIQRRKNSIFITIIIIFYFILFLYAFKKWF